MGMPTVNSLGASAAGTASITVDPGTPHSTDDIDIVLLECSSGDTAALTTANGFARITALDDVTTGGVSAEGPTQISWWWRRWNGSDGSPVFTDAGNHQMGRMISISGCKTTGDPWNTLGLGTKDDTSDSTVSIVGGTTTVDDCLVLLGVAQGVPDSTSTTEFSGWTNGDLANLTEQMDNFTAAGNGGGIGMATGELVTAGTFGATTTTPVNSSKRCCGMLALEGASGAAPETPKHNLLHVGQ